MKRQYDILWYVNNLLLGSHALQYKVRVQFNIISLRKYYKLPMSTLSKKYFFEIALPYNTKFVYSDYFNSQQEQQHHSLELFC
mmetsp:Transcript_19629/g.32085  ORF Transcript_19629/g.32085 Transcript_19629/m.32085 type:complete len:83 (-) Transcript_19629:815-1063(-)